MTWPKKVRDTVQERSGGVCEGCGERPGTNLHHRKYKSRGGADTADNALLLCGMGNVNGCHGEAHDDGDALGWSVHSWDNPAHVPVLYRGSRKWLTRDGRAVDVGETVF